MRHVRANGLLDSELNSNRQESLAVLNQADMLLLQVFDGTAVYLLFEEGVEQVITTSLAQQLLGQNPSGDGLGLRPVQMRKEIFSLGSIPDQSKEEIQLLQGHYSIGVFIDLLCQVGFEEGRIRF